MKSIIFKFNSYIAQIAKYSLALMVLVMLFSITARYVFGNSPTWQLELVKSLNAFAFFAIAGYAFYKNAHVKVDIIYNKLGSRMMNLISALCNFIIIPVLSIYGIYLCLEYVVTGIANTEGSRELDGLDFLYITKVFMLLFFITLLLEGLLQGLSRESNNKDKN